MCVLFADRRRSGNKTQKYSPMAYLQEVRCTSLYKKMGFHLLKPTAISHFDQVKDKVPVDNPSEFFRDHGGDYFVSCADFDTKELVLIKPTDRSKVRRAAFFNEALREHAEELFVIPFSQLADVSATVASDVAHITTMFIHIAMRCGSTLLIKALGATGMMHALSESDVYVNISRYLLSKKELPEDGMETLLEFIRHINTLFNYTLLQEDPSKTITCYKMRGQVGPITDVLQKALPKVKNIFLYRNLLGTLDSYAHVMANGRYWKYWLQTSLKLDYLYINNYNDLLATPLRDNPVFESIPVPHGIVWFSVCSWLELMQKAHELTKQDPHHFYHVILRYEELKKYKEEMVMKVMEVLGIKYVEEDAKANIRKVFEVNSQAGHSLASRGASGGGSWVGEWEMGIVSKILQHVNMGISKPDFVLDGTLTFGSDCI
ncbi:Hypp8887 [Branchiostoma lanceolatum]|uniref:Hypp8887 protein n=1 Tax=Branchiostoma lanceolatum TaxID=7740 RepID=A0A8K0EH10_BRALA|nr:Hypp8887 [Branchiostoma lanceolatum]